MPRSTYIEDDPVKIKRRRILFCVVAAVLLFLPITEVLFRSNILKFSVSDKMVEAFKITASDNSAYTEFLNVGQGDCTVIKDGEFTVVVDFGPKCENGELYNALLKRGIHKIDLAVVTHNHADHLGGLIDLFGKIKINELMISPVNSKDSDSDIYNKVIALAKNNNTPIRALKAKTGFKFASSFITVKYLDEYAEKENNSSAVIEANVRGLKVLIAGDFSNEKELLKTNTDIKADALKLSHHGSATSTKPEFLLKVSPKVAVASCGYDNLYSHPSDKVSKRLEEAGIRMYRTDLDYSVKCVYNKGKITVITERG